MDDFTIAVMTVFTSVVCTLLLAVNTRTNYGSRSSRLWAWGAGVYSIGIALLALQHSVPVLLGIVVANISLVGGTTLICMGSLDFWDKDIKAVFHAVLMAAFSLVVIGLTFLVPSVLARIVVISFVGSFLCAEIAWAMFGNAKRLEPLIPNFIGGIFVLLAAFFIFRGFFSLFTGANVLFSNNVVSNAMFILLDFSMLGWSLGYIMLQNLKLRKNLSELNCELESRVKARTLELESSNKELESFAYAISHDLRTPLRAMEGFGTLLKEKAQECTDKDGIHYAERICEGATRMGLLIDKLLDLSRVGRSELRTEEFDLSALAREIAEKYRSDHPSRTLSFAVQEGMRAKGDWTYVGLLLSTLVDNAVKFTQERSDPRIEIGSQGGAYFVKDNGVGFDMEFARGLFYPFLHLHSPEKYPGEGIGLVTAARIVERHGGKIWAEAQPDRGACFFFTLGSDIEGK